ncbi:MAG: hypothetical protein ABIO02_01780 [Patescibacteria group bacterium]
MRELLSPGPTLTANFDHLRKGLVGTHVTEGISSILTPYGNKDLQSGLYAYGDSTTLKGVIGHLLEGETGYLEGLPLDKIVTYEMILANKTAALHANELKSSIKSKGRRAVVSLMGGEDLGKLFKGRNFVAGELAGEYGNINEIRDAMNKILAEAALESDAFISATCRGWQVVASLLGLQLVELGNSHRDEHNEPNFTFTRVESVLDHKDLQNPLYINQSYCNHHEGILLGDPRWPQIIAETGWRPYYVSLVNNEISDESTVEISVRLNEEGGLESVASQGHDEKNLSLDGYRTKKWRKEAIKGRYDEVIAA